MTLQNHRSRRSRYSKRDHELVSRRPRVEGATLERPSCDARTGYTARTEGWGWQPVPCTQRVGLVPFRDTAGHTRHHCSREGHRASAVRRYGEWVETDEARHEAHGGDETPDPADCVICYQALDSFLRYGVAPPTESELRALDGNR